MELLFMVGLGLSAFYGVRWAVAREDRREFNARIDTILRIADADAARAKAEGREPIRITAERLPAGAITARKIPTIEAKL